MDELAERLALDPIGPALAQLCRARPWEGSTVDVQTLARMLCARRRTIRLESALTRSEQDARRPQPRRARHGDGDLPG